MTLGQRRNHWKLSSNGECKHNVLTTRFKIEYVDGNYTVKYKRAGSHTLERVMAAVWYYGVTPLNDSAGGVAAYHVPGLIPDDTLSQIDLVNSLLDDDGDELVKKIVQKLLEDAGIQSFEVDLTVGGFLYGRSEDQEFHYDLDYEREKGPEEARRISVITMVICLEDGTPSTMYRTVALGEDCKTSSGPIRSLTMNAGDVLIHDAYYACHAGPARDQSIFICHIKYKNPQDIISKSNPCELFISELVTVKFAHQSSI